MNASLYFKKVTPLILAIPFLVLSNFINNQLTKPIIKVSMQDQTWNLNDKLTNHFNLGFKRLTSSSLWISTILQSDEEHYKKKDLNSWMFLRFKTISELEPLFYENYKFGGIYLSIVKDDLPGASYIYEKGLSYYPNDFDLLKNAAFHFNFEVGDLKKSYPLYLKLKHHPRTSGIMLNTLARLESENGNLEVALDILKDQYEQLDEMNKENFIGKSLREQLYSLKAEIDLDCLNSKKDNCELKDYENNAYFFNGKKYVAKKDFLPFKYKGKKVYH